ncbi:MAG: glycosyltransferase family 2 protein [Carboxylicivirga sp.]|jgi:glycosyltransferase involved in cell wall biosynthesis|nr:glycosyltransferase family 2 protein [Carboxylicivirga sp.]
MQTSNNAPLVTVAMVTYNSGKYVRTAIESVLESTYQNFELIISDDCSTDNTWEIINEYNDSRIRKFRNKTNLREYPNRNRCIDLAKGKYFIFIDGDDAMLPHGLETYVSYAEKYPDVGFIIEKGYYNNVIFPVALEPNKIFEWELNLRSLLTSSFSSNFFITDILKKEGKLAIEYKTGDDELRIRLALKYSVLFIPGWLTWPRETSGQASSLLNDGTGLIESIRHWQQVLESNIDIKNINKARIKINLLRKQLFKEYIKATLKGDLKKLSLIKSSKLLNVTVKDIIDWSLNRPIQEYTPCNYTPDDPLTNKCND